MRHAGNQPSKIITPAVMPSTGDDEQLLHDLAAHIGSLPTREITMAEATEISRPGICATSASPTASRM
jgi:hypothetical protein